MNWQKGETPTIKWKISPPQKGSFDAESTRCPRKKPSKEFNYLRLRYTTNANANAPKIAAHVAGSGITCVLET